MLLPMTHSPCVLSLFHFYYISATHLFLPIFPYLPYLAHFFFVASHGPCAVPCPTLGSIYSGSVLLYPLQFYQLRKLLRSAQ